MRMKRVNWKKVCRVVLAVLCVLLTALLAAAAVRMCREGLARKAENPLEPVFTPEGVAGTLAALAPLFWVTAAVLAVGLWMTRKDPEDPPGRDTEMARDRIAARVSQPSDAMRRERKVQRWLRWGGWGAFAACMAPLAVWLAQREHFPPDDLEEMFQALMGWLLPCAGAGIACLAVSFALRDRSMAWETQAARERLKAEQAGDGPTVPVPDSRTGRITAVRAVLAAAAIALILLGVLNGSALDVLYKAINICTECVGLG